jgi:hypothetical protein
VGFPYQFGIWTMPGLSGIHETCTHKPACPENQDKENRKDQEIPRFELSVVSSTHLIAIVLTVLAKP